MKTIIKLSFYFSLFLCSSAYAGVTDVNHVVIPSVSTLITLPNGTNSQLNLTTIDYKGSQLSSSYGQLVGTNLFHSFSTFNINSSEGVDFTNTSGSSIKNVISRVTGGSVSHIDGLLRSSIAGANFYFINPAGITFGANAVLDVPSAFHVSSADAIRFENGDSFYADTTKASTLSIAEPASFGFLGDSSATITVNGHGNFNEPFSLLSVSAGKTLDIVANNIIVQNVADLEAPSGQVRLVAFKGFGDVSTRLNSGYLPLPKLVPSAANSGFIIIDNGSIVSADGTGSGHTDLWGGRIDMRNGSVVSARTRGDGTGAVTIMGDTLNIISSLVTTSTSSSGDAGDIYVKTNNLNIDGELGVKTLVTGISSPASRTSAGDAGKVTIVNANAINIQGGGIIRTNTFGSGDAGEVTVTTNTLKIDGQGSQFPTGITSETTKFTGSTVNEGKAGTVKVKAHESIILTNAGKISSAATNGSNGYTGNVNVTADKSIQLLNGSEISIKSDAKVFAASPDKSIITVSAPDIELKEDSSITAAATGKDNAGDIVAKFSHWLTMDSSSFITTTATPGVGEHLSGNGGGITINGGKLIYLQNSGFKTSVEGTASNGGNINVNADALIMETGVIQANAVGGSGGDINISLKALIPSQSNLIRGGSKVSWQPFQSGLNVIQAASESGVSGAVNVNSPQFDISGSVSGLDTSGLVLPSIAQDPCQSLGTRSSSLARGSKGGIPLSESKAGFIPSVVIPNAKFDTEKNISTLSVKPHKDYPCATID